ncbi:ADP,ATP carrier protein 1 [Cardinium endosymbiont cEper1 of Encarsia pergandiella]|uniref:Npt1/Npt2 family nucleotide transporter n=1 Tax=Cardinium endosymbiont of Encarsia pergandiella TaxID=249402 RepID=UPI00027E9AE0|nr:Npt1/Npt2 family nucleotide transporter [Cardinium endosymbiont of Encarsia pergandiella]CCM09942.1 ADP,ATP carrier protein 1 [Cardinium endosymbiont cEper1 of Encarsia pergandiella]
MTTKKEFGNIRGTMFPIHKSELRKFLPMAFMFILISFCYSLTRSLKDMNMMKEANTTAIYWLKAVAITPSMIFFTVLYGTVSRSTGRDGRFNAVMIYFFSFFTFSLLFLLPQKETLQLNTFSKMMEAKWPNLIGLWGAICHWPISLFYIHAEAWGTFALSVVFWTFVNEITGVNQAKRFYSLLSISGAIGSILAGSILKLDSVRTNFDQSLQFVIIAIVLILIVYNYFTSDIKANPTYYQIEKKPKKIKVKMSFMESISFLAKSRYLTLISILVIGYGLMIALFEAVQKAQVQKYVQIIGDDTIYAAIYAQQQTAVGIIAIVVALFLATPILKKGWRFAASVTPITALVMTLLFFAFLRFGSALDEFLKSIHVTALYMSVQIGIYNVVLIKSVKYVLFDPTKEAVYIPLDEETKVRGKAAVDGVGARLGKSLASVLITAMSTLFGGGGIENIRTPIVLIIIAVIILWLLALRTLGKLKVAAEEKHKAELEEINKVVVTN